ncbi:MAG: DnaJ domain, partial [Verrucomicrobia bacterium]|nr:DnaJ domain [Verrucomicrobiota bacterium]
LPSAPAGLSLTGELRQTFSRRSRRDDWKPPPREERFDFICMRCGQKLRLRRFQSEHTIRCPRCQARYRGRLDKFGRLRIEPEAERSHRRETRRSADELAPHYRTLELPVTADMAALRRAYRRMMKQHHPDLYAMAEPAKRAQVEEKAKQINEAYHALMDHLEEKS